MRFNFWRAVAIARNTLEDWIPESWDGPVIQEVNKVSAIERLARRVPMKTATRHTPRDGGVTVEGIAKGAPYGEDEGTNDEVVLIRRKFGKAIRLAEEDVEDTKGLVDVIKSKQISWANNYAKLIDNASLAVTAAANGTTRMFNSVYYQLSQNNSDTGYTANDNITKTGSGGVTYAKVRAPFADYEGGNYYDPSRTVVIAHPSFIDKFRGVVDGAGNLVFQEGRAGEPNTLFGAEVAWSNGLRTSVTDTGTPTGNPLLIVGNRDYLILGEGSGPETFTSGSKSGGVGFLTDEDAIKMRAFRAFNIGWEKAFAVLENDSGS